MIRINNYWINNTFQIIAPFLKSIHNSKKIFVVDLRVILVAKKKIKWKTIRWSLSFASICNNTTSEVKSKASILIKNVLEVNAI